MWYTDTQERILKIFRRHPDYFVRWMSFYYPFTEEQLEKYQEDLYWSILSENIYLKWSESLLKNHKEILDWSLISRDILGVKGVDNDELLNTYLCYIDFDALSQNERIYWSNNLIKEHEYKLNWKYLMQNEKIIWSEDMLFQFEKHTNPLGVSLFAEQEYANINYYYVDWTEELLDKYRRYINFDYIHPYSCSNGKHLFPWEKLELDMKFSCFPDVQSRKMVVSILERFEDKLWTDNSFDPFCFNDCGLEFFQIEEGMHILNNIAQRFFEEI